MPECSLRAWLALPGTEGLLELPEGTASSLASVKN